MGYQLLILFYLKCLNLINLKPIYQLVNKRLRKLFVFFKICWLNPSALVFSVTSNIVLLI